MRISDWSSDVCSSDLADAILQCDETAADRAPALNEHLLIVAVVSGKAKCVWMYRRFAHAIEAQVLLGIEGDVAIRNAQSMVCAHLINQGVDQFGFDSIGQEASKRSEEHTSELQSLMRISYAVFCLKKKK